jgi:hypothetical protein
MANGNGFTRYEGNLLGMNNYKKQHYLPRFYLRNFSSDRKGLCCCSRATKKSERRNIDKLFREPYFYADSSTASTAEPVLSKLEDKHAKIIQKILKTHTLTINSREDLIDLSRLVFLMASRTKATKKYLESRAVLYDYSMEKLGLRPEELGGKKLNPKSLNVIAMELVLNQASAISGLANTLLINKTNDPFTPFITSDSPVIRYNLIGRDLTDKDLTGFLNKGLIIVLPLSEEVALCLFDGQRYKLKNDTNGNIIISDNEIIDALNRNLIIKADEFFIFSRPAYYKYVLSLQDDSFWGPRHIPIALKLPFFEIYNEATFQGLELFKFRNEEILASIAETMEEVSEKHSNLLRFE